MSSIKFKIFYAANAIGRKIGSTYTKSVKPLIEQFARRFGYNLNEEAFEKFFKSALPGAITGKGLDKLFKGFLMWLRSRDPVSSNRYESVCN